MEGGFGETFSIERFRPVKDFFNAQLVGLSIELLSKPNCTVIFQRDDN